MQLKILEKKDNPLLDRTEVRFEAIHEKERTPQRATVREQLAAQLGAKVDLVVVDHLTPGFGRSTSKGFAKVYSTVEKARYHERDYHLKRNNLFVEKPKREKKEGEAEAKPAKPAARKGA